MRNWNFVGWELVVPQTNGDLVTKSFGSDSAKVHAG